MSRNPYNQYRFCSCFDCYVNHGEEFVEPQLGTLVGYKICKPATLTSGTHYIYKPWSLRIYILDRINTSTGLTLIQTKLKGLPYLQAEEKLILLAKSLLNYYSIGGRERGIHYNNSQMFVSSYFIIQMLM
jgi:hypothetical protein